MDHIGIKVGVNHSTRPVFHQKTENYNKSMSFELTGIAG